MTAPTTTANRRPRNEGGIAALMVALTMTALCVVAALVLDIGLARYDKQDNQASSDIAAAAGIRAVAAADGKPRPFSGVCEALEFLQRNSADVTRNLTGTWKFGNGSAISGNPCTSTSFLDHVCDPSDVGTWAWYTGTADGGDVTVDIKSGYDIAADTTFPSSSTTDQGSSTMGGCDQIAVIVSEKEPPLFGSVTGQQQPLVTRVRSVARVTSGTRGDAAVALLLLERSNCKAIEISGDNALIRVEGNGRRPGYIHTDSLGNGSWCSTSDKIVNANAGPPARVTAAKASAGSPVLPGVIGSVALSGAAGAVPANAADPHPAMVLAEEQPTSPVAGGPVGRSLVGRELFDRRYGKGVSEAVTVAKNNWNMSAATAAANNYEVVTMASSSQGVCIFPSTTLSPAVLASTRIFVNCADPNGVISFNKSTTFTGSRATLVFNAPVRVEGSGTILSVPEASNVYVKGRAGSGLPGLQVTAQFWVNQGGGTNCSQRSITSSMRARMVIGSGSLTVAGNADAATLRLCHTSVIMASGSAPEDTRCPLTSTLADRAPYPNLCNGNIAASGGAILDWTAPNAAGENPTPADHYQLEDLAFWTETSGTPRSTDGEPGGASNSIAGSATNLRLNGVFFAPNADPFTVSGNGTPDVRNAQFVARRLRVAGSASFVMAPNPFDVVTVPYFGDTVLVR